MIKKKKIKKDKFKVCLDYHQDSPYQKFHIYDVLKQKKTMKYITEFGWYFGEGVCFRDAFDIPYYLFKNFVAFDPYDSKFFSFGECKENQLVRALTNSQLKKQKYCRYLKYDSEYLDCIYLPVLEQHQMLYYQDLYISLGESIYNSSDFIREENYDKATRTKEEATS